MRNWRLDEDEDSDDGDRKPDMPMTAGPVQNALYKSRTVLIFGEIDMRLAERVTAQLLALSTESDKPIKVVINSPGGHVESGDTIHDMIKFCGPQVKVIGTDWVASAGAHIFLGATKENRLCLPNTRFLLHQPMGGGGDADCFDADGAQEGRWRSYSYDGFREFRHAALVAVAPGEHVGIGKRGAIKVRESGLVLLFVNDTDIGNNSGELHVRVRVTPP